MNFIILADKFQKGMKSKGAVGLLNINKQKMIEHQYQHIKKKYPHAKMIYVYGFDSKKIEAYSQENKKKILYIHNSQYETKNYAYSLYMAKEYLNDECFITFGDTVFKSSIFKKFMNDKSQIFINKSRKNELGCIIADEVISNISFGLTNYISDMYFLTKQTANLIQSVISDNRYHNYFIFELINKTIDEGQAFYPYCNSKKSVASYKEVI